MCVRVCVCVCVCECVCVCGCVWLGLCSVCVVRAWVCVYVVELSGSELSE